MPSALPPLRAYFQRFGEVRCLVFPEGRFLDSRVGAGAREALPPSAPKLSTVFPLCRLSRRLSDASMQEEELNRSAEQAHTRRELGRWQPFPARITASAGTDATRCGRRIPAVRDVGRALRDVGAFVILAPNPAGVI